MCINLNWHSRCKPLLHKMLPHSVSYFKNAAFPAVWNYGELTSFSKVDFFTSNIVDCESLWLAVLVWRPFVSLHCKQTDRQSHSNKQRRKTKQWHCWIQLLTISCRRIISLEYVHMCYNKYWYPVANSGVTYLHELNHEGNHLRFSCAPFACLFICSR